MRLPAFEESLRKREEKGIEKGREEGIEIGIDEGIKKGGIIANLNNAIRMFDDNVSIKDVIKFTRIPEENVQYISSLSENRFKLVIATSKRARQIAQGSEVLTEEDDISPVSLAADEIVEGNVKIF